MLNKDQIQGEWDELKGRVKRAYAELTEDDFTSAQGSRDKLFGIIEKKFGDAKAKITEKLNETNISDKLH